MKEKKKTYDMGETVILYVLLLTLMRLEESHPLPTVGQLVFYTTLMLFECYIIFVLMYVFKPFKYRITIMGWNLSEALQKTVEGSRKEG